MCAMMDLRTLRSEIGKLSEIIEGWSASAAIPEIERDMALGKLRSLYEAVRFADCMPDTKEADHTDCSDAGEPEAENTVPAPEPESAPEPEIAPVPEPESAPDEPELVACQDFEPESVPEFEPELKPESEQKSEPEPEIYVPVSAPTLFGLESDESETEKLRHRHKQRVILSLYGSEPERQIPEPIHQDPAPQTFESEFQTSNPDFETAAEPESEIADAEKDAVAAKKPIIEEEESIFEEISLTQNTVLGEVINPEVQTLADTLTPRRDVASEFRHQEAVSDLRQAIGLNDKFLLIRDLFDGDGAACDQALELLNGFEDLDDCMIYIAENYAWNPNSDGAKFLMELIERKFA